MNVKQLSILLLCITLPFFYSCKSKEAVITDTVEQISALTQLKDVDIKTLASMLGTSEQELFSIVNSQSKPSAVVAERSNELYEYVQEHGKSFKKLRAAYDPDFLWCDHILQSPTVHPWWFWSITGILAWFAIFRNVTLSFIRHSNAIYSDGLYLGVAKLSKFGLVVEGIIFLIAYLFSTILK